MNESLAKFELASSALSEYGIELKNQTDDFNDKLLSAMEKYAYSRMLLETEIKWEGIQKDFFKKFSSSLNFKGFALDKCHEIVEWFKSKINISVKNNEVD